MTFAAKCAAKATGRRKNFNDVAVVVCVVSINPYIQHLVCIV